MARPRKIKSAPMDSRTQTDGDVIPEEPGLNALFRQSEINRLRVDPFDAEPLACVLAPVLLGRATESERRFVADLFAEIASSGSAEQLAGFFARVEKLKSNVDQPHRIAAAYFGYARYIEETGREPIKPELKAYLIARPESFKGMPPADDKKAWTRLWEDCGLSKLADR